MVKRVLAALTAPLMILGVVLVLDQAALAAGFSASMSEGASAARGVDMPADLFGQSGTFSTISNVMLFLIGAISVIMLIIGGIRYVVSGGDSTAVQGAKNTILYAIVGIVVALLAYAVVNFVISSFAGSPGSGGAAPTNV